MPKITENTRFDELIGEDIHAGLTKLGLDKDQIRGVERLLNNNQAKFADAFKTKRKRNWLNWAASKDEGLAVYFPKEYKTFLENHPKSSSLSGEL